MIKAGEFEISVSDPYPCWIRIDFQGQPICRLNHTQISDLQYAVNKAVNKARLKLGKDAAEV